MTTRGKNQKGFTLIEVLVAVLVISIGLLGLAGLQAVSLRNNHSAYLRSQATLLGYDVLDRMRANAQAARNGNYNVNLNETPTGGSQADVDLGQWKAELDRALPDGDGRARVDGNNVATIFVRWDDQLSEGTQETSDFTFQTQLTDG